VEPAWPGVVLEGVVPEGVVPDGPLAAGDVPVGDWDWPPDGGVPAGVVRCIGGLAEAVS
jgi:hypothetical protein